MWNNLALLALTGLPYPIFISDRSKLNKNLALQVATLDFAFYVKISLVIKVSCGWVCKKIFIPRAPSYEIKS